MNINEIREHNKALEDKIISLPELCILGYTKLYVVATSSGSMFSIYDTNSFLDCPLTDLECIQVRDFLLDLYPIENLGTQAVEEPKPNQSFTKKLLRYIFKV